MSSFDQSLFDEYLQQNGIYPPYPEDLDQSLLDAARAYASGKSMPTPVVPDPFDEDF